MPGQPTPLCRCRVLYIGSAVPLKSKDGLQGIQEPLKHLYPADLSPNGPPPPQSSAAVPSAAEPKGVDAWLSVWINGLVLEHTGDNDKEQFFPIQTLHYCAAVRYVNVAGYALEGGGEKFLPLDSPFANLPDTVHPPIFAAILRRTQGVRVLECHAFICTNEKAANALVKCCFNAYADSMYLDMSSPEGAQNGHVIETTESSLMGTIKEQSKFRNGIHDLDSLSPKSDDPDKSGYQDVADHSPRMDDEITTTKSDTEKEQRKWTEAKAKYNWQQRQQPGDYETASISSSLAGKYKKKEQKKEPSTPKMTTLHQKRPPSIAASYSNALVPYGQQRQDETFTRRRARSEMDLHAASRGAMMPYMPPPPMMPWPMFPPGPGGMMPPPGSLMPPPPPGGFMPPPPPPGAFGPPPMFPGTMPRSMPPPPPLMPWGQPPPALTMPPSSKHKHKGKKKSKARKFDTFSHLNAQYMPPPPQPMFPPFRSFEEPPYLPGQMPPPPMLMRPPFEEFPPMMAPRGAMYAPQHGSGEIVYPYDNESPPAEDYIENYKSVKQQPQKVKKTIRNEFDRRSIDESTTSSKHSFIGADYWENRNVYDGTLFRRQNLNEKAFGTSMQPSATVTTGRRTYEERVQLAAEPAPDYNGYDVHQRSAANDIENRFRNMNIKVQQERHIYNRY